MVPGCWKFGSGSRLAERWSADALVQAARLEGRVPLASPAGSLHGAVAPIEETYLGQRGLSWMPWAKISGSTLEGALWTCGCWTGYLAR